MPLPHPAPAHSRSDLDSIFWRTTDLLGHFAGKRVFIAGHRGFYGSWMLVYFAYLRDVQGLDVSVSGGSHRDGFDIIRTRTYPPSLKYAHYVLNCAGRNDRLSAVELGAVHGLAPSWIRQHMRDDAVLLQVSSGSAGNPQTEYARAKLEGEKMLASMDGPVQIVRPFATVGPGMGLNRRQAVPTFIFAKLAYRPLEIPARPVIRSFAHIADLVVQCLHVMVYGDGRPYEVGSDSALSIADAARLISDDVRVVDTPFPSNAGLDVYVPDLTRVYSHFNVRCDWDSQRAIRDTARYYGAIK